MGSASNPILTVNVSIGDSQLQGVTLSTPCICAPLLAFGARYRDYASTEEAAVDFEADDPILLMVGRMFQQEPKEGTKLQLLRVARQSVETADIQIVSTPDTGDAMIVQCLGNVGGFAKVTVNDSVFTASAAQSAEDLAAALVAAINGGSEPVTATDNLDGTFTLQADVADTAFYVGLNHAVEFDRAAFHVTVGGEVSSNYQTSKYAATSMSTSTPVTVAADIVAAMGVMSGVPLFAAPTDNTDGTITLLRDGGQDYFTLRTGTPRIITVLDQPTGRTGWGMLLAEETPAQAMTAVSAIDDGGWYFLDALDATQATQEATASYILTKTKLYVTTSEDAAILDPEDNGDIFSILKDLTNHRTYGFYHPDGTDAPDAAILGNRAPNPPGIADWFHQALVNVAKLGQTDLTTTQRNTAMSKNANLHLDVGTVGDVMNGVAASGRFFDLMWAADYIAADLVTEITRIIQTAVPKIPYTDPGFAVIGAGMASRLQAYFNAGLTASFLYGGDMVPYVLTIPTAASQSSTDRNNRHVTGFAAQIQFAGGVLTLTINVTGKV